MYNDKKYISIYYVLLDDKALQISSYFNSVSNLCFPLFLKIYFPSRPLKTQVYISFYVTVKYNRFLLDKLLCYKTQVLITLIICFF